MTGVLLGGHLYTFQKSYKFIRFDILQWMTFIVDYQRNECRNVAQNIQDQHATCQQFSTKLRHC